jgi:hypothetical protein
MRACVAAVLDKRQFGVWWSKNVVVVQVNRRIKLVDSHIRHDSKFNAYFISFCKFFDRWNSACAATRSGGFSPAMSKLWWLIMYARACFCRLKRDATV